MVKRVGQKKRGNPSRKTKKIILMGTEGSNQTERKYFSSFNQLQNEYRIHVLRYGIYFIFAIARNHIVQMMK